MSERLQSKLQKQWLVLYLAIFSIIAVLAIATYFSFERKITQEKESAHIINISGRQRMLSQYIAINIREYIDNPTPSTAEMLRDAIDEMRTTHAYLTSLEPMSEALQTLYFKPFYIDKKVQLYLNHSQEILIAENKENKAEALLPQRHTMLSSLEKIVNQYQKESELRAADLQHLHYVLLGLLCLMLFFEAVFVFFPGLRKIKKYSKLALFDPLTKIYNRRHFLDVMDGEHKRCLRYQNAYSLMMIDIDHFKVINDTYGHAAGDHVIKSFADSIQSSIRTTDSLGRIGGEEFAVLLVDTTMDEAIHIAEKLRAKVEALTILFEGNDISCTASFGLASCSFLGLENEKDSVLTIEKIMRNADSALYKAKNNGRNTIHSWRNEAVLIDQ
ncbi:MAG: diguanylate cyclase [Cellvibrionaceae bacterium]